MLKNILNSLKENEYKNIIYTIDIESKIIEDDKEFINKNFSTDSIKDIRSATFYALGKENLHNNCILIVEGDNIQNILTGITETWFQKLNIVVVALYKRYDDIKTEFLCRVMPNIVKIYEDDYKEYEPLVIKAAQSFLPSLITLKYNIAEKKFNYDNFINLLDQVLSENDEAFLYSIDKNLENCKFKIKNIDEKYKYCIISKYMGYILGKNKKILICMPAKFLLLDLNILNNRYIDKKFKIILFNCNELEKETQFESWIHCNGIKTIETNKCDEKQIKEFWDLEEPTMLLVKGEI